MTNPHKNKEETKNNKKSSRDEIAKMNFFTTISHTYFNTKKDNLLGLTN